MKNNIFKKFIVLLSLGFILFGFNFVNAVVEETPGEETSTIVTCTEFQTLTDGVCIDKVVEKLACEDPQIPNEAGDECVDVVPEVITCTEPQTLIDGVCTTPVVEPTDPVSEKLKEQVIIRNGENIVYDGFYELPETGIISIPDKDGVPHDIDARSVIAILYGIDSLSNNFSISTLEYSSVYNSLYMKCLTPNEGEALCDNWQYVVNNSYPYVGMDKNVLVGNERIYIYFGQQNRVLLSKDSIQDNEELAVTTEKYDYENNLWLIRSGVIVGVTKPDPSNPWSPNDEIQKRVDDTTGIAVFSSVPEGEYNVGVKEDYYWPTEKLTVIKFIPENTSGSIGGSNAVPEKTFSISKALEFLTLNQKSDGSFGAPMYTDWVAIALGAGDSSNSNLVNYFKSNQISTGVITDYERRAMALMALGINPYDGTGVDYIKKIVDSFDGTQFGDDTLINDDIFALIVLKNAGYSMSDEIIKKDIEYIISKQSGSGSWDSIDMTAAGIQALTDLHGEGISELITKAENYLISNQKNDGGFDNTFSTSWALQVLTNENNISKAKKYLDLKQQLDGGVEDITSDIDTRVWSTAYAIPAILHKSWSEILSDFSKPEVKEDSTSTPDISKEEAKEEIIVSPVKVTQEEKEESPKLLADGQQINKTITKKNEIKKIKEEKPEIKEINQEIKESNPLMASAIVADGDNNKFFSIISSFIDKIKAPFMWLLVKLGF